MFNDSILFLFPFLFNSAIWNFRLLTCRKCNAKISNCYRLLLLLSRAVAKTISTLNKRRSYFYNYKNWYALWQHCQFSDDCVLIWTLNDGVHAKCTSKNKTRKKTSISFGALHMSCSSHIIISRLFVWKWFVEQILNIMYCQKTNRNKTVW